VIEATNGAEALRMVDQGVRPTVIVSDVMMPGETLFETCCNDIHNYVIL
jgi:CheY-like chemotaxis protein